MDLRMNPPAQPAEANLAERVIRGLQEVHLRRDLPSILTYGDTAGSTADRDAGARWLGPRLGDIDSARVLVSPGAQGPLTGWFTMFAKPGDTVVTEALTYPAIWALCVHFGVNLIGVACDDEGIIPEALRRVCGELRPRLLYCRNDVEHPSSGNSARRTGVRLVGL
jgi:DNA-binding transcriptional MocR family regulator